MSDSLRPHGPKPARLPCLWNSPGKNIGVGCHALLQGTFPEHHRQRAHRLNPVHVYYLKGLTASSPLQNHKAQAGTPLSWDAFAFLPLCDPVDCSLPGSSVHRILQARILEWVAMPSSKGSSHPRDQTPVSYVSCIGRQVLYH